MGSNRYAMEEDENGNVKLGCQGENWKFVKITELKAFIGIQFLMGSKKKSKKSYWHRYGSIFHYLLITELMGRNQFMALNQCLHITNGCIYV